MKATAGAAKGARQIGNNMSEYQTAAYRKARAELLADSPLCHWCRKARATELDHLNETDNGGTIADGYVPSCKPCNSRRGAEHLNRKRARATQSRNAALNQPENKNGQSFFVNTNTLTPTPFSRISQNSHDSVQSRDIEPLMAGVGSDEPRLETPVYGYESFGPLIAEFAATHLNRHLFPWQVNVLTGAFEHDEDNVFTHSSAMAFCARQQGKTFMLSACVGFALLELPRIWGRPVKVVSTAHELSLATEVFEDLRDLFELWEESGLCKVTWAYGRHRVKMVDGSEYLVKAATGKKHGISGVDILIVDELWAITEAAYFGALKPAQIAVKSGLSLLVSTAGDESSTVMKKLREQAIGQIDKGEPGELYMAEWSVPESVSPDDERYWGYANPSMPRTVTLKSLRAAHASPDRSQWLRAHCNMWVSAASSWLPPGQWAKRFTENSQWDGTTSVLAVDSAVDDSKYVGVWCRKNTDGDIVASVEFQTESIAEMWERITQALEREPKTQLAITPSLFIHTPEKFQRRTVQWGYGEINKYTSTVKGLINEDRVKHTGEVLLSEHVNRAVLIRGQGGALSISSQRSPGPIEACRCLIVAVAMVSRPGQGNKPTMGSSR
jgi:hypothetical protein